METLANDIQHKSVKVLFTGASGTGKTNAFLKYLIGATDEIYKYLFIFDHQNEIADRLNQKGLEIECFDNFEDIQKFIEDDEQEKDDVFIVCFDPSVNYAGFYEEIFEEFLTYVFDLSQKLSGKKLLACDELQILTGNLSISRPLQAVLQTGRRRGLDCAFCSQAPNELHNKIRNQITHLFVFRTLDDTCLQWIKKVQLPNIERLMTLKDGQAVYYKTKTSEESEIFLDLAT